jgi:hypothetical protein
MNKAFRGTRLREILSQRTSCSPTLAYRLCVNRGILDEELRSKFQYHITKLREIKLEPSFYNTIVNTPEFSRFVFIVPGLVLVGTTALSLSSPSTLPLIFEKLIPYHIKTIAISLSFHSFVDLAINVLGRPTPVSHHRLVIYSGLSLTYLALMASAGLLGVSDYDPHQGYKASMLLVGFHALPALYLPMPHWIRVWRLGFLGLAGLSVISAWRKLDYLESHWDDLIFTSVS